MFRNMVTSLFKHERIRTTVAKAKELRRLADHVITLAKRGDLHARRQALAVVREKRVVHKLFEEANEKFGNSAGGYTRVVKLGRRSGDAAPMSLVELVVPVEGGKKKAKKKAGKPAAEKKRTKAEKKDEIESKSEKEKSKERAKADEKETKTDVKSEKAAKTKPAKSKEEKKGKAKKAASKKVVKTKTDAKADAKSERASKKKTEKSTKTS